jgi:hypothetical protein
MCSREASSLFSHHVSHQRQTSVTVVHSGRRRFSKENKMQLATTQAASASSNPSAIDIVKAVCGDYDGAGIASVGANAAILAMAHHWSWHLQDGQAPGIISTDIEEMKRLLDTMHSEIVRRMQGCGMLAGASIPSAKQCKKCGSEIVHQYCEDDTCPYSEWPQHIPLHELETVPSDDLRKRYGISARIRVHAEVHDDLHTCSVQFDAAAWFEQSRDEDIVALHDIGWGHGEAADVVALHFDDRHDVITGLFIVCRSTQGTRNAVGFECSVDADSAMAWIKHYRPGLWARLLCKDQAVSVKCNHSQQGDRPWSWHGTDDKAATCSFPTAELAALDAVEVLELA